MIEVDRSARLRSQARLRQLSLDHADELRIFRSHDAVEFDFLASERFTPLRVAPADAANRFDGS